MKIEFLFFSCFSLVMLEDGAKQKLFSLWLTNFLWTFIHLPWFGFWQLYEIQKTFKMLSNAKILTTWLQNQDAEFGSYV